MTFEEVFPSAFILLKKKFTQEQYSEYNFNFEKMRELVGSNQLIHSLIDDVHASFFEYVETVLNLEEFLLQNNGSVDREIAKEKVRLIVIEEQSADAMIDSVLIFLRNANKQNIAFDLIKKLTPIERRGFCARMAMVTVFKELREKEI